jgi:L-cysteine:1D-myo-inositol 2-amino-2-deoxy-alpha-D-glucopyranoside ligase
LLTTASTRLDAWRSALSQPTGPSSVTAVESLAQAIGSDLDTPAALEVVDAWVEEQRLRGGDDPGGPGLMSRAIDAFLGVA